MKQRKPLVLFIICLLTVSLAACGDNGNVQDDYPPASEGLKFTMYDTYCEVSGIGECQDTNIVIPRSYNDLPVTGIVGAFFRNTTITSVIIPDSVTTIGLMSFKDCTSLESVTIEGGTTAIDMLAFANCTALTSVKMGEGVTAIGDSAFSGCTSLTDVTIPDSVTTVGHSVFWECRSEERRVGKECL